MFDSQIVYIYKSFVSNDKFQNNITYYLEIILHLLTLQKVLKGPGGHPWWYLAKLGRSDSISMLEIVVLLLPQIAEGNQGHPGELTSFK